MDGVLLPDGVSFTVGAAGLLQVSSDHFAGVFDAHDDVGGERQSLPMDRPFLHAEMLELDHPVSGRPLRFESPLPADLATVLERLS